jgi:hypothetical protein
VREGGTAMLIIAPTISIQDLVEPKSLDKSRVPFSKYPRFNLIVAWVYSPPDLFLEANQFIFT